MIKLLPITNAYIKDNFNIVEEAETVTYKERVGELNFDFENTELGDVLMQITDELKNFPDDAFVKTEYYGYDGGADHIVYVTRTRLETESETIERLKKVERATRKEAKKIQAAKDLLAQEG